MSVTLSDIAKRASVSTATVSRVLNNYPYVSERTRALVWRIAQDVGYISNRNLNRSGDTPPIVLLMGMGDNRALLKNDETNIVHQSVEFSQLILQGANSVLNGESIRTHLQYDHHLRLSMEDEISKFVVEYNLCGIILLGGRVSVDFIRRLQRLSIPTVIAGIHLYDLKVNGVMADYSHGIYSAVNHLVERGRRYIGLFNSSPQTQTHDQKYKGYRLALATNDLVWKPSYQTAAQDGIQSEIGFQQTKQLLETNPEMDAIIYGDDYLAAGGIRAIKDSGQRVPDDIAVVGFHDYEVSRFVDPPLTTIHFSMRNMGTAAAERLLMIMSNPDSASWYMTIPTSLVIREST